MSLNPNRSIINNLYDINNIKDVMRSTSSGDSGAHNIMSEGIPGLVNGNPTSIWSQLNSLKNLLDFIEKTYIQSSFPNIRRVQTVAVADGGHYSEYYTYDHLNNNKKLLSGNTDRLGAWIASPVQINAENNPYIEVDLPYGVVIGDSVAMGAPGLCGRLQPEVDVVSYDDDYPNAPGQLSYELGRLTGMYWFNHGIGGQTSGMIWSRWRRDVLGETYDVGDGAGSQTLPRKAYAVWINAGVNDITLNVDEETIKTNLLNMAISCKNNGIVCVFDNIGDHNIWDTIKRNKAISINTWMKETLPKYGAYVCDFYSWASTGLGVRSDMFADNVHPSKWGYQSMSLNMYQQISTCPINYNGMIFNMVPSLENAFTDLAYAKDVKIRIIPAPGQTETAEEFNGSMADYARESSIKFKASGYGYKARVIITSIWSHTTSLYVGFSNIDVVMGCPANIEHTTHNNLNNISCRVYNNTNITIPNGVYTILPFNSERYGAYSMHSMSSNIDVLTCKVEGTYDIKALVVFATNSTGVRAADIFVNNTDIGSVKVAAINGDTTNLQVSAQYYLYPEDVVRVKVYQNSGTDLDIRYVGNISPEFMMTKID